MATLNDAEAYLVTRSAYGYMDANLASGPGDLATKLYNKWSSTYPGVSSSSFLAVAVRAWNERTLAEQLTADPTRVPTVGQIPQNLGIAPEEERFLYTVRVHVESADGSQELTFTVNVRTDEILTSSQARAIAEATYTGRNLPSQYREDRREIGSGFAISSELIAVGKRR